MDYFLAGGFDLRTRRWTSTATNLPRIVADAQPDRFGIIAVSQNPEARRCNLGISRSANWQR